MQGSKGTRVQGSNGHNDDDGSGNNPDSESNVIPLRKPPRNAGQRTDSAAKIRTTILMGGKNRTPGTTAHPPAINLPPMTKFLVIALILIEAVMKLALTEVQQYWVMSHFGFVPAYYSGAAAFGWPGLVGPVTYGFLHGGWTHVGLNVLMLMAFGAGLERWMGWKRLGFLMLACSVIAALIHLAFNIGSDHPVIGASGAISGMFAAAMVMLQQTRRYDTGRFGLLPFALIWVGISVAFGMMGGPNGENVAWIAHIGGFLAGLALIGPIMRLKRSGQKSGPEA